MVSAPEILLGYDDYSVPVDVWSIGCIFCEMVTAKPLFPGDSEIDQLFRIFRTLGTPTEENWPGVTSLPKYEPVFPQFDAQPLRSLFQSFARRYVETFHLMEAMLIYDPRKRITPLAALNHAYFDDEQCERELQNLYDMAQQDIAEKQSTYDNANASNAAHESTNSAVMSANPNAMTELMSN